MFQRLMHESLLNASEYTDGNSLSYLLFQYRLSQKYTKIDVHGSGQGITKSPRWLATTTKDKYGKKITSH